MLARETSRRHRKRFITTNPSRTPHTESQKFTIQELTRTSGILRIVLNARTKTFFFVGFFFLLVLLSALILVVMELCVLPTLHCKQQCVMKYSVSVTYT